MSHCWIHIPFCASFAQEERGEGVAQTGIGFEGAWSNSSGLFKKLDL
jgi:hypothetical protein